MTPAAEMAVTVPGGLMERFRILAESQFRTPEAQVLWLMTAAVDAAERGHRLTPSSRPAREQRLASSMPVFDELRKLHVAAGSPPMRAIAARTGESGGAKRTHTGVHAVLTGTVAPSWPTLEAVVRALGGDTEHFRRLWAAANE